MKSRHPVINEGAILQLDNTNCIVQGRHGIFLVNKYDFYLGHALIRYGECSELEHQFLLSLLTAGDNVVEVGANIGVHTVGLARHIGPHGVVIAVEPQPHIFRVLNANLTLNNIQNVITHAIGCGAMRSEMIVPPVDYGKQAPHNSGGVSLQNSGPGTPVQIVPLDELAESNRPIKLLKVDVEGMEIDVLNGAARLIDRYRPILYLENDRLNKRRELIAWVLGRNYRLWWHTPRLFNPDNFFGDPENIYANIASINMICFPRESGRLPDESLEEIESSDQDMRHIPGM